MFDVNHIVQAGGLILLFIILYSEVGLFLGFFLPGDTLLIAVGIYAATGKLSLVAAIIVAAVAAILGDNTGYLIGKHLGPRLFKKPDGIIFRHDHIAKAERFYKKYGAKTLLVSHFFPVVRTFTPLLAGVGRMPHRRFAIYNAIGDITWATSVTMLGYYFGSKIPNLDNYILLVIGVVIVVSVVPTVYRIMKRIRAAKVA